MQKVLGNVLHGSLFIVSAPAGTGKTTLVRLLTEEFHCVVASVSYTTREPRSGEINGVHYNFIEKKEFEAKIADGEFLEYAEVFGCYYGTSRVWVDQKLAEGKHVVLVIDTQGALKLKGKVPAAMIFIQPPSMEELARRLAERQTESPEKMQQRLDWAKKEMIVSDHYDYIVINDDLNTAYQVLKSIFIAEEHKM